MSSRGAEDVKNFPSFHELSEDEVALASVEHKDCPSSTPPERESPITSEKGQLVAYKL